jgi:DNA-binding response OmpR family regulator
MNHDHILLADDNYIINLELHEALQDAGFAVESVYSGATAIAALRCNPPWALVTDLDLGSGPTGFDVARYARTVCPYMPVVFISGTMGGQHPSEGVSGSDFIAKPCRGGQVVEALLRRMRLEAA